MADAWKAAKFLGLASLAFTEKTIPAAQWTAGLVWAQKNHRGLVALSTVKLHWGSSVALGATNWKPESMPWAGAVWIAHGVAKVD